MTTIPDNIWQTPVHRGYTIECCSCGMRHKMDFRIRKIAGKQAVQFRARRIGRNPGL